MMANMASSLILHKRINTTVAKAKALRGYVEPLITKSKLSVTTKTSPEEASHLRRMVFSYLQNKEAVTELFREVSTKVIDREGGYTRIIKTGTRLGDNAEMCMMELVDYNENLLGDKGTAESRSRRRRRGGKKKADEAAAPAAVTAEAPTEEVAEQTDTPEATAEAEPVVAEDKPAPEAEAAKPEPEQEPVETPEDKVDDAPADKTAEAPAEEVTKAPEAEAAQAESPEAKTEEPAGEEAKDEEAAGDKTGEEETDDEKKKEQE
jgi:large subunit ribosomal protein L17